MGRLDSIQPVKTAAAISVSSPMGDMD